MAAVEDAVLVAGGMGSRMLPASAAIAKEALPLVDIPALSHLAREAVAVALALPTTAVTFGAATLISAAVGAATLGLFNAVLA